jgi:DNA-binding NtrC family response regulator
VHKSNCLRQQMGLDRHHTEPLGSTLQKSGTLEEIGLPMLDQGVRRQVFVVDDELIIASTLATILNLSGFSATGFESAEAAIQAAETQRPDLLITDVIMPGMNGIDSAIKFKSHYPDCKTLLFSGQTNTSDLLSAAISGGHNFPILAKPVHPAELLAAVRTL